MMKKNAYRALVAGSAVATFAVSASLASAGTPDPSMPEWIAEDGSTIEELLPDLVPAFGPDGEQLRDGSGNLVWINPRIDIDDPTQGGADDLRENGFPKPINSVEGPGETEVGQSSVPPLEGE